MNVLVTGGLGYIGSHTVIELVQNGYTPVIFDNLSTSKRSVLEKIKKLIGKDITFVLGDLRDHNSILNTFFSHNINSVIHMAGSKSIEESNQNPLFYYDNNVIGTISLLKAMDIANVRKLVFSSSATVYGQPSYLPIDEEHSVSAENAYGRSKIQIEEILKDLTYSQTSVGNSKWKIICLRYFNPVGAHDSGLIGEDPLVNPTNLMPILGNVTCGKQNELFINGSDYQTVDGTAVRDYIHIMDLAEGHTAALLALENLVGWHKFNLGTGRGTSVLELLHSYEKASGQSIKHSFVARRNGDAEACFACTKKANHELKWRTTRSVDEMCVSSWRFLSGNN